MPEAFDPGRAAVLADLEDIEVREGVARGRWRFLSHIGQILIVAVRAGDGLELGMRVDLTGYPAAAPAGIPWDLATDTPLAFDLLPRGGAADQVFRSAWSQQQQNTPYMATERVLISEGGHPAWPSEHPERFWNGARTIGFYLDQLSRELAGMQMEETK